MRVSQFVDQLSEQQLLLLWPLVEEVKDMTQHLLPHLLGRVVGSLLEGERVRGGRERWGERVREGGEKERRREGREVGRGREEGEEEGEREWERQERRRVMRRENEREKGRVEGD